MKTIAVVFGTRPEAIKMVPVIGALRQAGFDVRVIVTAQHRRMLDQVLDLFDIVPDADLNLMQQDQALPSLFAKALTGLSDLFASHRPEYVLVHGDTTTTAAGALAAFYARIPVGHVEAGLRTGDMQAPWPEEMNRRLTTSLATLHFAPTTGARDNLLAEGIAPETIHVTGNTVVDAMLSVRGRIESDPALEAQLAAHFSFLDPRKRMVLVTGHRRESFGDGLEQICQALKSLASRGDVQIVYPVHLNPNVQAPVNRILAGVTDIHLIEPQDYLPFVYLMSRAYFILTDSGGVQEEAPSFGKPVLVMRESTERPEAVSAGMARLVGTSGKAILNAANQLLDHADVPDFSTRVRNPFGDGSAASLIARILMHN